MFFAHLFLAFAISASAQEGGLPFPITMEQFSQYYVANSEIFEFTIKPEYEKHKLPFTEQEKSIPIKAADTCVGDLEIAQDYLEAGYFYLDDYLYKIIIYNGHCDGWIPALNFQLNSYDKTGMQLDALMLENRFAYEDIERFANFTIDRGMVSIDYYFTVVNEPNEIGDLGEPIENPVPEFSGQGRYKIENGYFSRSDNTDGIKDGSE